MKLRASFSLPLLLHLLPVDATTITRTLNFDDLPSPPSSSLTPLPTPYNNLTISSAFSLFAPASHPYILPADKNCATSAPNALLGSALSSRPTISVLNDSTWVAEGLKGWFGLKSMNIKPLAAPEDVAGLETVVIVRGYPAPSSSADSKQRRSEESEEKKEVTKQFDFPTGYHLPFTASFPEKQWRKLSKIEIWAEFGEDQLDWEFCVDDIVVEFEEIEGEGNGLDEKRSQSDGEEKVELR